MKSAHFALMLLVIAATAQAEEFNIVHADKSTLGFVFKQMGVSVEGHFGKFSAQLKFDPAKPAAASAAIDIDLASIDAGSPEANDEVAGKQWFSTKAFPNAHFVASTIRPLDGNRYEAVGKMTIKGKTQDITAPFTFTALGRTGTAEGALVIKRADFGIGEGPWADFDTVANEVQIRFRLQAEAGPAHK
jgi:polyisoprenoid-binding protein YceI